LNSHPSQTALLGLIALLLFAAGRGEAAPARPPITGVSHIALYAADPVKSETYYEHDLGGVKGPDPENSAGVRYYFGTTQFVELLPLPGGPPSINRLDHVAFATPDAEAMRRYLAGVGLAVPARVSSGADGSRWFDVVDPENHKIEFVQPPAHPPSVPANALSNRMLHVGFIVHDSAAEDSFFINMLGFRVYWQGGFSLDKMLWIWRQLPEGRDWLEYMIAGAPDGHGIPQDMTQDVAGAMNHFALGVANVEASYTLLWNDGRLPEHHNNPMIGHSAKWEFGLFDPDGTRTEVMEFHAIGKACCSPVTAAEPDN
jgi:catechol 2,3-dioxygenase-like lactoylglutathione lyase family enzyme